MIEFDKLIVKHMGLTTSVYYYSKTNRDVIPYLGEVITTSNYYIRMYITSPDMIISLSHGFSSFKVLIISIKQLDDILFNHHNSFELNALERNHMNKKLNLIRSQ